MSYKNLDLRRATTRERVRRYRANVTPNAVTPLGRSPVPELVTPCVTPERDEPQSITIDDQVKGMVDMAVHLSTLTNPTILDEFDSVKVNASVRPKRQSITLEIMPTEVDVKARTKEYKPRPIKPHDCRGCNRLTYRPGKGLGCPRGKVATSIQSVFETEVNPDRDCKEVA